MMITLVLVNRLRAGERPAAVPVGSRCAHAAWLLALSLGHHLVSSPNNVVAVAASPHFLSSIFSLWIPRWSEISGHFLD